MSCLGKTDCNLASRISCSLHRAAIPSFIYSQSPSLATWWWFTDNQSVGAVFYVFKHISSGGSDKIQPISAGTNLFKKASCQQGRGTPRAHQRNHSCGRPGENTLLDVLATVLGKCRKAAPSINWESIMKLIGAFVSQITQTDQDSGTGRKRPMTAEGALWGGVRGRQIWGHAQRAGKTLGFLL